MCGIKVEEDGGADSVTCCSGLQCNRPAYTGPQSCHFGATPQSTPAYGPIIFYYNSGTDAYDIEIPLDPYPQTVPVDRKVDPNVYGDPAKDKNSWTYPQKCVTIKVTCSVEETMLSPGVCSGEELVAGTSKTLYTMVSSEQCDLIVGSGFFPGSACCGTDNCNNPSTGGTEAPVKDAAQSVSVGVVALLGFVAAIFAF